MWVKLSDEGMVQPMAVAPTARVGQGIVGMVVEEVAHGTSCARTAMLAMSR